jgi:hypothetical protein
MAKYTNSKRSIFDNLIPANYESNSIVHPNNNMYIPKIMQSNGKYKDPIKINKK